MWIRTGCIKNLDIYLPIKEKTPCNPAAIFISFSYQKYIGIFLKSMLDFIRKVISFTQFFYEVHIKKVTGEELGGEGEDTGGTLVSKMKLQQW